MQSPPETRELITDHDQKVTVAVNMSKKEKVETKLNMILKYCLELMATQSKDGDKWIGHLRPRLEASYLQVDSKMMKMMSLEDKNHALPGNILKSNRKNKVNQNNLLQNQ